MFGLPSAAFQLPAFFSFENQSTPGVRSSSVPPFCRSAYATAPAAAAAWVGLPFSATAPLYSGFSRSSKDFGAVLILLAS